LILTDDIVIYSLTVLQVWRWVCCCISGMYRCLCNVHVAGDLMEN